MADDGTEFWIDVGGTFTDCVMRNPAGRLIGHKLLSSGRQPTVCAAGSEANFWHDPALWMAVPNYYAGYEFVCEWPGHGTIRRRVQASERSGASLQFEHPLPGTPAPGLRGELISSEEAPVAGIRWMLGRRLDEPVGPIRVRLGTTRATNALLERRGARAAFVTTAGFADALRIGYQDRPALFSLRINQPPELYERAVEIRERLDANGGVLRSLDEADARVKLTALHGAGVESLAVCLLHAYRNPAHEERLGQLAAEIGFTHVSLSSRVSPLPKFVYRGDTTVLDAYLTPVLSEYCRRLCAQMPEADVRFMASAGSLLRAEEFSGKDAILSGPAGGVVGMARVAERAGFAPVFAFDMGGTSTDVSRWDGDSFARRYELETGGGNTRRMRLQSAMLEIETVAAGGGSVCWFDGQKLAVGPRSAGAEPGPACYGRGGPLTVTDLNFFLGKIPRFPFALDRAAVEARLDELLAEIATARGGMRTRAELAVGFLRVANANMVAPIKKLAAAHGLDVRRHTLVAFGGAGGQHACAIARELGMSRILCPEYAGVLSAVGIGLAPVTKFAEQSLPPGTDFQMVFRALEADLRGQMRAEGISDERLVAPRRLLEMRYRGQESRLTVAAPPDGDFFAAFACQHERIYNFTFPDRPVEVYAVRVELSTRPEKMPSEEYAPSDRGLLGSTSFIEAFHGYDDSPRATAVFVRDTISPGERVAGPAIVYDRINTVVVEPGWTCECTCHDDLVLTADLHDPNGAPLPPAKPDQADPVELELFHNRFASVAEQMGATLQRTALSTNVKERLDFSCALFDAAGSLVANAAHIPVHLGAMEECVRCLLADVPDLRPGEVYLTNDPFRGGSHLPDVTVITPVFVGGGQPRFFTASRAHHAEIGGIAPGSLPPDAHTLAEEGVLLRAFRYRADDSAASDEQLRRLLLAGPYPTRAADENLADIHAQIAANQAGATLLAELVARHGLATVEAYATHLHRASEARMRAALARRSAGTCSFADAMDDGTPICVAVTTDAEGRATFDFTGSGPVHPGNLNANRAIVASAVIYCLRCLLGEPVPLNAGLLAPVTLVIPPGTILDPPSDPDPARCPAVGGGNVETSQRLVDVIFGALGSVAASQGTMNNFLFGRGGAEAFGYYETIGGGAGAGSDFDGASAVHTHMTNTRLTDPEVLEARYPVRLREWAVRRGSGGGGAHPGGDGMVREVEFLAELDLSLLTNRRARAPYGADGGGSGAPGRNRLRRPGEAEFTDLPPAGRWRVGPGDVLRLETPGGGGWGADVAIAKARPEVFNTDP